MTLTITDAEEYCSAYRLCRTQSGHTTAASVAEAAFPEDLSGPHDDHTHTLAHPYLCPGNLCHAEPQGSSYTSGRRSTLVCLGVGSASAAGVEDSPKADGVHPQVGSNRHQYTCLPSHA